MTDKPKAAHFDAFIRGKKLAPNDPVGLEYRWHAANRIKEAGVWDMLRLRTEDRMTIQGVLSQCNTSFGKHGMKVLLADFDTLGEFET